MSIASKLAQIKFYFSSNMQISLYRGRCSLKNTKKDFKRICFILLFTDTFPGDSYICDVTIASGQCYEITLALYVLHDTY